jgi:hypothetical protein
MSKAKKSMCGKPPPGLASRYSHKTGMKWATPITLRATLDQMEIREDCPTKQDKITIRYHEQLIDNRTESSGDGCTHDRCIGSHERYIRVYNRCGASLSTSSGRPLDGDVELAAEHASFLKKPPRLTRISPALGYNWTRTSVRTTTGLSRDESPQPQ